MCAAAVKFFSFYSFVLAGGKKEDVMRYECK